MGLLRTVLATLAVTCAGLGLAGLYHYLFVPRRVRCGNCMLGTVGGSLELILLGVVIGAAAVLNVRYRWRDLFAFLGLVVGIGLTSLLIGIPIYAISLSSLAAPVLAAATARGGSAAPEPPPLQRQSPGSH